MAGLVTIIDYGAGNLRSVAKAFEYVARKEKFSTDIVVTKKAEIVKNADHIILPGQGAFGDCMNGLQSLDGMVEVLEESVLQKSKPFLGICVGMQLLADTGFEHGTHKGLGWISGIVDEIKPKDLSLKIPHMGWNNVHYTEYGQKHPVLKNLPNDAFYYFVHSFMFKYKDKGSCLGKTEYGSNLTSIIGRDNIIGTQFHPEKSQSAGLELIANFLKWKP